jgi:tetratricopeptide (TPR) repeat protein
MRAHVAAGRPAAALAAYARSREVLADELGVDPSAATVELHGAILRGEVVVGVEAAAPAQLADLVGRQAELAAVAAALTSTGAVAIEGDPGIGKTALLARVARDAAVQGCVVLRCVADRFGRDLSLQPVLDGLTALLRERSNDIDDVLQDDAALLAPLLGTGSAAPQVTVLPDTYTDQARVFAAVLAVCVRAAAGRPLLVTLDDADLADAATLAWAAFAHRRAAARVVTAARQPGGRLPGAQVVAIGPLDCAAAEELVGPERAPALHRRSGGNPLFLIELARSGDAVPETIRDAVVARAERLGPHVAQLLKTASSLGPDVDLDLLAHVLGRPAVELLADAEAAAADALLVERGHGYGFASDVVREALAAGTTAARHAFVHREAARVLSARPGADARTVAWHARLGDDLGLAARALAEAGAAALRRYDHVEAERLLDEAVDLSADSQVLLTRARTRLARWDVAGAVADADRAVELGAGPAGFEVRGWSAYYARDYDTAQRYADEGALRAEDAALRASCLALAGRTRHARGLLAEAAPRLAEASECAVPEIRSVACVWRATLSAHEGRPEEALDLAERALLDSSPAAHPFARFHGAFARLLALGMQGRAHDVTLAAERLGDEAARAGRQGERFVSIADNMRAWPLRALGHAGAATDLLRDTIARTAGDPVQAEPHYVARLDLVETLLASEDVDAATAELTATASEMRAWSGTMAWRAWHRHALLTARRDLAIGAAEAAATGAAEARRQAELVGNARHAALAGAVLAQATRTLPAADVEQTLLDVERCAGLESWLVTAELAAAYDVDRWWRDADHRAAAFVAGAGPHADDARRHVERAFRRLGR